MGDTERGVLMLTLMLMLTTADTAMVDMVDTVLASLTTDTAPLPTSTGLPRDCPLDMVDTATTMARGVLMLMLMLTMADTATVTVLSSAMPATTLLPGLLSTVMASNPPSMEPVDTPMDTARGVLMLSPLLRLMLMLTTAMVGMVDTAMDMVDTVMAMVMEDTVMDTDMATVVDTVMDMVVDMDMV